MGYVDDLLASKKDVRTIAFHESGHTVMCHLLNRSFDYVTVTPNDEYNGRVEGIKNISDPNNAFDNCLILAAGVCSESILKGSSQPISQGEKGDFAKMDKLLLHEYGPNGLTVGYQAVWKQSEYLLRENWQLVQRIAEALLTHGTLTEHQVKTILR